jgi:hypothetical protein
MPRELIDTGTDKRYVRRDNRGGSKNPTMWEKVCPLTGEQRPRRSRRRVRATEATVDAGYSERRYALDRR